mmetsp:Transcript_114640/g.364353  ORF Transcript_114640/g.364353 Transcript_114640/m.364353 type:complete len:281 (-) Transcript_114640:228-1070(-)
MLPTTHLTLDKTGEDPMGKSIDPGQCRKHIRALRSACLQEQERTMHMCACGSTRIDLPQSLRPVHGRLDQPLFLADRCRPAIGHRHTHGQHRRSKAAAPAHLRGVGPGSNRRDELRAGVHDVGPLEERLLNGHVPLVGYAPWIREPDGAGCRHERDVGHTGQHNLPHDAVVGVHPHDGGIEHGLRDDAAFGQCTHAAHQGVVDLAPLECLLAILAPGELLRRQPLPGLLQRALLGLDACESRFGLVLPLLPISFPLFHLHTRLGGEPIASRQQHNLTVLD